jgi:hypothetical protein
LSASSLLRWPKRDEHPVEQQVVDDLEPQARKNGTPAGDGIPIRAVASMGETAEPNERAAPVTPDTADRSSGLATATVQDCRVGTSICEMLNRSRRRSYALSCCRAARFSRSGTPGPCPVPSG